MLGEVESIGSKNNADKSSIREKEVYFRSQFQVTVHHGGEVKAGAQNSHIPFIVTDREANADMLACLCSG